MGRRFDCTIPGREDAFVILPDEWLGKHALKRDEALKLANALENTTVELSNQIMALCLAEDWGGIPGIEGNDPTQWRVEETPLLMITWMTSIVIVDFNAVFAVPKNSFEPSPMLTKKTSKT